jgi:hypothetical protein
VIPAVRKACEEMRPPPGRASCLPRAKSESHRKAFILQGFMLGCQPNLLHQMRRQCPPCHGRQRQTCTWASHSLPPRQIFYAGNRFQSCQGRSCHHLSPQAARPLSWRHTRVVYYSTVHMDSPFPGGAWRKPARSDNGLQPKKNGVA